LLFLATVIVNQGFAVAFAFGASNRKASGSAAGYLLEECHYECFNSFAVSRARAV
jgi:hypothetical protein